MSDINKKEMASLITATVLAGETAPQNAGFEHWQAIHSEVFEGMPDYRAGENRPETGDGFNWSKGRSLDNGMSYDVHYADNVDPATEAQRVIGAYHETGGVKNLEKPQAAEKIAKLYSDLDYVHPMYEGNSRSLRAFTAQVARADGYDLRWDDAAAGKDRDEVYLARDREVIDRKYPGLDFDKAMTTDDRREYETFIRAKGSTPMKEARSMAQIIEGGLEKMDKARAFEKLPSHQAVAVHPELKTNYDALRKAGEAASQLPDPKMQATYIERVSSNIQKSLESEQGRPVKEATPPPKEQIKSTEPEPDMER